MARGVEQRRWWRNYRRYLKSEAWQDRRKELYRERGGRCEDCGRELEGHYHAHHMNYTNVGDEPLRDLRLLCEDCHKKRHPRRRVGRRKKRGAAVVVCAVLLLVSILFLLAF
jgi:5-methylcytosine-specific restriction endonuclease McrA